MDIRFAGPQDKAHVLSLLDELGEEINKKRGYNPHNSEATRVGGPMFERVVGAPGTMIFVADDGGTLVGLISFYLLPNMRHGFYGGHVEDVVVAKSHRRNGVGTKLFTALKKYCKDHHVSVIKLDSGIELTDAHAFYEKQGGVYTEKMYRFDI